jgi:hypothetical protein
LKRYSFKYTPEPTKKGVINRPTTRVFLQSTKDDAFRVYVDSGADLSLFRKSDAKLIGLDLYKGEYHPVMGIAKTLISTYIDKVKITIEETTLDAIVSFADSDGVPRLLGRTDIFKHFKITFDENRLEIIFEAAKNTE